MIEIIAASMFLTTPAPIDMPRATAYLVTSSEAARGRAANEWGAARGRAANREGCSARLEDRFVKNDLWFASVSLGRWSDDKLRVFSLYRLDAKVPAVDGEATVTRTAYADMRVALNRRDKDGRREAIAALSPVPIFAEGRSPHQLPRGYDEVEYWQEPTNLTTMVCAFRPKKCDWWYLAVWELDEGDDIYERMEAFEEQFLVREFGEKSGDMRYEILDMRYERREMGGDSKRTTASGGRQVGKRTTASGGRQVGKRTTASGGRRERPSERELLRADAHWSVAAYRNWRWTDSPAYTVLDDLTRCGGLVATLTNSIPALFKSYAETVPSPIDGTNVLCVARIYDNREEYLEALTVDGAEEMVWSAAYWSPLRRELVAHLPDGGERELLKTFRHEAFHQYLSYACAMTSASPWFNEGYAQYFEDTESVDWELGGMMLGDGRGEVAPLTVGGAMDGEMIERLGEMLPGVMLMDYEAFYGGSDEARRLKYRLAWSLAVFIEKGAPKVRFQPFKNLKRDYVAALIDTGDMRKATVAAFGGAVGAGAGDGASGGASGGARAGDGARLVGDGVKLFVREWKKFWGKE